MSWASSGCSAPLQVTQEEERKGHSPSTPAFKIIFRQRLSKALNPFVTTYFWWSTLHAWLYSHFNLIAGVCGGGEADKSLYPHIIPVGKEKAWSFPSPGWEIEEAAGKRWSSPFPAPPDQHQKRKPGFLTSLSKPASSMRRKNQTPAPSRRTAHRPDTARPHLLGTAGGSAVMVDTEGGDRRGALACPLRLLPLSGQVAAKATRGRRTGDPLLPAYDGYLRVLLSQLLVLPLQLCRGHGLPRPVQARLPRPLSPTPRPQPQTRCRVWIHQLLPLCHRRRASSSTSGFAGWEEGGVGPGVERPPGAGRRLTSPPHPPAPEHVRAQDRWPSWALPLAGAGGAILTHGPRWRPRTGKESVKRGRKW